MGLELRPLPHCRRLASSRGRTAIRVADKAKSAHHTHWQLNAVEFEANLAGIYRRSGFEVARWLWSGKGHHEE